MSSGKVPSWIRVLEIVAGLVAIAVSFYVIARPGVTLLAIAILFTVALLLLGIARIAIGAGAKGVSAWSRWLNIAVGVLALVLAIATAAFPMIGDLTLAFIFAFGLLFNGIGSVSGGYAVGKAVSSRLRYATMAIGILGILLAFVILTFPLLGLAILVLLLALNFLLFGIELIALGAVGRRP